MLWTTSQPLSNAKLNSLPSFFAKTSDPVRTLRIPLPSDLKSLDAIHYRGPPPHAVAVVRKFKTSEPRLALSQSPSDVLPSYYKPQVSQSNVYTFPMLDACLPYMLSGGKMVYSLEFYFIDLPDLGASADICLTHSTPNIQPSPARLTCIGNVNLLKLQPGDAAFHLVARKPFTYTISYTSSSSKVTLCRGDELTILAEHDMETISFDQKLPMVIIETRK